MEHPTENRRARQRRPRPAAPFFATQKASGKASLESTSGRHRNTRRARPLSPDEKDGLTVAVQSVFRKLDNLYREIIPCFEEYGFKPPSAGVVARDLSEKIEDSIRQHCNTFERGPGPVDLQRNGEQWEVKICKGSGLTINQSKRIAGENYIVINYRSPSHVKSVWVLWCAEDDFFSPRKPNANARAMRRQAAEENIEVIFQTDKINEPPVG